MPNLARLQHFITALGMLVAEPSAEAVLLARGRDLLRQLVSHDDWLPDALAQPHPEHYTQYLLYADAQQRFSVVSFVWGPGQATPVHDHTVWGLIGMLRGSEISQGYETGDDGRLVPRGEPVRLLPGDVEAVSPAIGDIHRVNNAFDDRVSISIHVYGANIGTVRRSVFGENGARKSFVSGYSNDWLPNIWHDFSA